MINNKDLKNQGEYCTGIRLYLTDCHILQYHYEKLALHMERISVCNAFWIVYHLLQSENT